MQKWEAVIVTLLAVVAIVLTLDSFFTVPGENAVAVVSGPEIETQRISLREDGVYHIEAALPVTLRVEKGRIRFEDSKCPDHICEKVGWIEKEPQQAVCMPAGVVVSIEEDSSFYHRLLTK